jgi:hypothetical protein
MIGAPSPSPLANTRAFSGVAPSGRYAGLPKRRTTFSKASRQCFIAHSSALATSGVICSSASAAQFSRTLPTGESPFQNRSRRRT